MRWLHTIWDRAVNQIQKRIKAQGKNPNQWVNLYDYLQRNQARNGR